MNIFITGGTSGIGLAIAEEYVKAGHRVGICGRNIQKVDMNEVHAKLKMYPLDVCNKTALEEAVGDFSGESLDLMIIAAGNYSDGALRKLTYDENADMLKVNIAGTLNALEAAREIMGKQRKGHIAAIASVSGLLDYPKATVYSKTKRVIIQICDAYRRALSDFGIDVTTIIPGYVDTLKLRSLNHNDLSGKPFVVSCQYAATTIIKAIEQKKQIVIFPPRMKYLIRFLSLLPDGLLNFIMLKKAQWAQKK